MFQDLEARLQMLCGHRGEGNIGTDTPEIQWIFLLLTLVIAEGAVVSAAAL